MPLFLRAFLALIALACVSPAQAQTCAPVTAIIEQLVAAGRQLGGARIDLLQEQNALAFIEASHDASPRLSDHILAVASMVPDKPGLKVVITYISVKSCIIGQSSMPFDYWNAIRVKAGLKAVARPLPGISI